jgi:hypothetical protein
MKNVIAGVQATERELQSVLERHGVTRIESIGKPFNADFHQAMMEVEDPSVPAGTVVQEMIPATCWPAACCAPPWSPSPRAGRRAPPKPATRTAATLRRRHPPQGEIEAAAFRQQPAGAGQDAVDPVDTSGATGPLSTHMSPLRELHRPGRALALGPPSRNSAVSPSEIDRMGRPRPPRPVAVQAELWRWARSS